MGETVLNVGLDPARLNGSSSAFPQVDAAVVEKGIADARSELASLGLGLDVCFVDVGETDALRELVSRRHYEFIMVGGGVRLDPALTPLFEAVVNIVLKHSPGSTLCFNTGPGSTVEAVRRWWPARS